MVAPMLALPFLLPVLLASANRLASGPCFCSPSAKIKGSRPRLAETGLSLNLRDTEGNTSKSDSEDLFHAATSLATMPRPQHHKRAVNRSTIKKALRKQTRPSQGPMDEPIKVETALDPEEVEYDVQFRKMFGDILDLSETL